MYALAITLTNFLQILVGKELGESDQNNYVKVNKKTKHLRYLPDRTP